jgi:two-component system, LytTR family, sensor histidine kinase AlgZ
MHMPTPSKAGAARLPRGFVVRLCAVSVLAALACTLILINFEHPDRISLIVRDFVISLIYSCSIAFLSALVLYRMGRIPFANRPGAGLLTRVCVLLATNAAGCMAAGLLLVWLHLDPWDRYWDRFRFAALFGTVITLTVGLGMNLYQQMRARLETAALEIRTRQMEEERAYKLAAEARLSSLESRIHPHFLFNTLNSIASLIPKDPKRAEDMVGKLASLLRFSLNANQSGIVPLHQELKIVRAYLEIEKARFDARLRYTIEVPEELESIDVPPLSVQCLVENSIKHVIAHRPEGGEIRVTVSAEADRVELAVSDSGPGFAWDAIPLGHGLDNLASRLALLCGPDARLEAARNGKFATVRMSLPRSRNHEAAV